MDDDLDLDLMSGGVTSDDRIDSMCDAFEAACLEGEPPKLEVFLDAAAPEDRELLFSELLMLDYEYRRRGGASITAQDYVKRFPGYAAEIEALGFVGHWDDTVVENLDQTSSGRSAGRRFLRFELMDKLGSGASGEVWKARDLRLQRIVALKIPHRSSLQDEELYRFLREARAAAQLRHPNIVPIYETGREGSDVYIVSDYIEGQTLRDYLAKGRLTHAAAARLCADVAEALHHAHELGIVHRDVKPANILLDARLKPYVADFGLAKWAADAQELTLNGQLIGTPSYMSPEQASGAAGRVDARSDVFALGVVLYELLTGSCPFKGDQPSTIRAIIESDPSHPRAHDRRIPRDLETICLKSLEKDPKQRYDTAQAMALDLRRFLEGEPILARRSPLHAAWKLVRRRRVAIAASVLLAATVAASAFATLTARQNRQLQGYRTVTIETVPPGARVAFVPLSKTSSEPDVKQAVLAGDDDPIVTDLKPGDYFVIAALPDGRFHEVYRHVPDPSEIIPGTGDHRRSQMQMDGSFRLPKITIPVWIVDESMAFMQGSRAFEMGMPGPGHAPRQVRAVAPFYMDAHEFTVADALLVAGELPSNPNRSYRERRPTEVISVDFDYAVRFAEDTGKRLPTEAEYEYAATAGGTSRYPWGDELEEFRPKTFTTAPYDRHRLDSRLRGLCSGKAEWTMSWQPNSAGVAGMNPQLWRAIRGGDLATAEGDPSVTVKSRDPRKRSYVKRYRRLPGLGFRCVRSAVPLLSYEEME